MKYIPHPYQKYATEFIKNNPVSAIFLSCGLGKSVITLTAISDLLFDSFEVCKVLVIAPLRVARDTWPDEIGKWDHLKHLRYSVAVGDEKTRLAALRNDVDIYIINRENVDWLVNESGVEFDFDMIVIDELSSFKNGKSKRFKSLLQVRPIAKRIVGLTGTPASNGLMDLWAEFRVLDLGKRLGRFITRYRQDYFLPDKTDGRIVFSYKPRPGAEDLIYDRIGDITISMKSEGLIKMPELVKSNYRAYLSMHAESMYEELKKEFVLSLGEKTITSASAGVLSQKLQQVASGFLYTNDGEAVMIHDSKLQALEDIVESAVGQSLLVAYWFKEDRDRILNLLDRLGVSYVQMDSSRNIEAWKSRRVQIGLLHPASAGHGLNIQSGGSTLIWYSVPWSLELYEQTVARLWRQGQQDETVVVMHIVAAGTIDERIVEAIETKRITQDALLDAVKAEIGMEVKND